MTTTRATITFISPNGGHGFAQADDGRTVFINRRFLPPGGRERVGLEIEVETVIKLDAVRPVRIVERYNPPTKPSPKPIAVDAADLPPVVAAALGMIDDPQRRTTKRDRVKV